MKEESSDDPKSSSDEKNRDEKDTKGMGVRSKNFGPKWTVKENRPLSVVRNAHLNLLGPSTSVRDRFRLDPRFRYCFSESAKVTIVGQPEAQWKAQFCIFDKLKQEGWFGQEEGRLTSQITIPGILVGRVIGKGGVNVRELQVKPKTTLGG